MAKLHELLAASAPLAGQAQATRTELMGTFNNKRVLFQQKLITYTPLDGDGKVETREQSDIQSSIHDEIEWISGIMAKAIDAAHAIDVANTEAKGDIVLEDGTTLVAGVPASALLQLEKRLKETAELIKTIPTLDPAKAFKPDASMGTHVFVAREVVKDSTKKVEDYIVVVQPTKEHPAQTAKVTKDVKVGTIREQEWSSLITPATKAELLERCEGLYRAVTQARSRANDHTIEAKDYKIGKLLLGYVFQPLNS